MPGYALIMSAHRRKTTEKLHEWPITQDWIAFVEAWCEKEGHGSKARLAKAANIEPGTLSGILAGRYRQSIAVPSINKMVGLAVPTVATGTIDEGDQLGQLAIAQAQLDGEAARIVDEQIDALLKTARLLARTGRES